MVPLKNETKWTANLLDLKAKGDLKKANKVKALFDLLFPTREVLLLILRKVLPKPIEDTTVEDENMKDINAKTAYSFMKEATKQMIVHNSNDLASCILRWVFHLR